MRAKEAERELIEKLLEEEASLADDPTQNALLPPAPRPSAPDEPTTPDLEPEAVLTEPEAALAQTAPLLDELQSPPPENPTDLAELDESQHIHLPDPPEEPQHTAGEDLIALQELPEDLPQRAAAQGWVDGEWNFEPEPPPPDPDDPYGRAMADVDWKMTLQSRDQSLM